MAQDERRTKAAGPGGRRGAKAGCPFCSPDLHAQAVARLGTVFAVPDAQPVAPGHVLVIPLRHTPDYFTMTDRERRDADALLRSLRDRMLGQDPAITGFNVGANCGASAGQKVMHAHVHLIPRREGGQVKGVIRNKFAY